ncbi:hypothetical protein ACJX0J_019890, partial [Zea mays]
MNINALKINIHFGVIYISGYIASTINENRIKYRDLKLMNGKCILGGGIIIFASFVEEWTTFEDLFFIVNLYEICTSLHYNAGDLYENTAKWMKKPDKTSTHVLENFL